MTLNSTSLLILSLFLSSSVISYHHLLLVIRPEKAQKVLSSVTLYIRRRYCEQERSKLFARRQKYRRQNTRRKKTLNPIQTGMLSKI
jgi:hypothetical protein